MDLSYVIRTAIELIVAVDACSTYPKSLTESMKSLKDKLTSTQGLLAELGKLVKEDSSNTILPPHSHITAADSSQTGPTLQLINDRGQLQLLRATLSNISTWLDTLESKSKSKKLLSVAQLRPSRDDQKKVQGFLDELESCKSTASLVLSPVIRYVHELA